MREVGISPDAAHAVQTWARERIEIHRSDLEAHLDSEQTWLIRGKISELRSLIRAVSEKTEDAYHTGIDVEI